MTASTTSSPMQAEQSDKNADSAANEGDLENVLEALQETAEQCSQEMTVGEALDAFASRSFGALLTVLAAVAAMPLIGAIPGVSILTGSLIILVAAQFLAGRKTPWAPQNLRDISIDAETVASGVKKARPYAARIDALIRPRLTFLTQGPVARTAIALAAIGLALLFYPAALLPGAVWAPALSILALGLGLLGDDGALTLVGFSGGVASIALVLWLV